MTETRPPSSDTPGHNLSPEFLHDLRTPLNHIIGYCEMLLGQAEEEGQSSYVPDLTRIQGAGQQLLALLNDGAPQPKDDVTPDEGPPPRVMSVGLQSVLPEGDQSGQSDSESSQALILVVDDNKENRDLLARRLQHQHYGVVMAENGREAIDRLRAQAFDLLLLDIMMPEIDGYEVLRQIKADESLRHIPVIMVSALDELDSVVRCIEMGADDYLPKPFEPALLKARVGACLEKKRAHDRETDLFAQLEQNFKRLQELEQLRDSLTYMIIHDLRTPLSSVISGMQTVEGMGELNADQQEAIGIALVGGSTLLEMVNGLLDVDKMESGSMQLDYSLLDAAALVASALDQVAQLATDKGLALVKKIDADLPAFQGDEDTLRRTLVNLVGNAIKFTPTGGTVTVAVRHGGDRASLVFSVHDTGKGIPAEAFERIFEKFGQVESRQGGRMMSTGLGLTFCKLAVESHGGNIGVESVPDEGSVFSFTIPLAQTG
ncbi:MAG: response regulator [Armatimonadetes bacterium]|nr:response regulator [Armatimonadota bacterium]